MYNGIAKQPLAIVYLSLGSTPGVPIAEILLLQSHHVKERMVFNWVLQTKNILILHKKCVIYSNQQRYNIGYQLSTIHKREDMLFEAMYSKIRSTKFLKRNLLSTSGQMVMWATIFCYDLQASQMLSTSGMQIVWVVFIYFFCYTISYSRFLAKK